MPNLSSLTEHDTATNVVVFIADSLRFDYLPSSVSDCGITARTIAPSTYTATSIPSMMTGRYPANHRVWSFNDVLSDQPELFKYQNTGMDLRDIWIHIDDPAQKAPNRILGLENQETIEEAETPFTVVVHDRGAHSPYDYFNIEFETSLEYFKHYAGQDQALREEYAKAAASTADRFFEVVELLKDRGVFDDTLVIFTSDHGELLGERDRGGLYAHGSPVCPELVEVPTVFAGCGLPEGETYTSLISGTDIAPTALGAQNRMIPKGIDGVDLWNDESSPDRIIRSDFWANAGRVQYGASSAWNKDGGIVQHHGTAPERLLFATHRKLYKGTQAAANRRKDPRAILRFLSTYGKDELIYGSPDVSRARSAVLSSFEQETRQTDVEELSKDQLRALGYIE
ncbi:sulfatase-like hydrolase/transferase [Haloterrigena sp. SYSU A121-1]|uniref:Sulfatase-like hydrolase/transferase n=1 Tax=Haloterrigena gelatinilytica TaxID=2741724 RepID=A0A8J8GN75_9EURY|nr:sulfatase-like hydrolase/transferase [Haloterrigena gelatinilytica]NUB93233.1 sulfatase-like hydrolase/transferase [Haloterrigena gelatinilytica]